MAPATKSPPQPRRRPGGRSARVREAALAATLAELAEGGYRALSLERVASRAGVHKTTLYRRWGTREALVLDAMLARVGESVPVPDTGTLRGDLLALVEAAASAATTPEGEAVLRAVAGAGRWDEGLAGANGRFWATRLELDAEIVERAVARGEIGTGTEPGPVLAAVLGPLYFRLLTTGEPVDRRFLERVVDIVVAGVTKR